MTSYGDGAELTRNYVSPASGTESLEGSTTIAGFTNGVATASVNYDGRRDDHHYGNR